MSANESTPRAKPENDVIIVAEGEILNANRNALMNASSVFSDLLEDAQISQIEVTDIKEIVEQLLEYVNTGQVTESMMQLYATDLLDIANKVCHNLSIICYCSNSVFFQVSFAFA